MTASEPATTTTANSRPFMAASLARSPAPSRPEVRGASATGNHFPSRFSLAGYSAMAIVHSMFAPTVVDGRPWTSAPLVLLPTLRQWKVWSEQMRK